MESIRFKNFKGFEDTDDLQIRPITILIGPNSSGKSSLIQPLLMLKQTVDSRDVTSPLVVNGSYVKLSNFESFVYNHELPREVEFSFSFNALIRDPRLDIATGSQAVPSKCEVSSSFIYNKRKKAIELNSAVLKYKDVNIKIERVKLRKGTKYSATTTFHRSSNVPIEPIIFPKVLPSKFYGYRLTVEERRRISLKKRHQWDALRLRLNILNAVEDFIDDINYIGPLRETPKSLYISGGELRKDVGMKGEYATDVLWAQTQSGKRKLSLINRVNYWIKQFGLGYEVKLKPLGRYSGFFQVIITNPESRVKATISDVGFGVSQVLPLIVEGFYSSPGSTLLIEQPEIHLHPKVQADLGDMLIELAKQGKKIIVETHSEHLLSRLARRVAEGETFTERDLGVFYCSVNSKGSRIEEIRVNRFGQFENWPKGFFEEDYAEALMHTKLISEKLKEPH